MKTFILKFSVINILLFIGIFMFPLFLLLNIILTFYKVIEFVVEGYEEYKEILEK